MAFDCLHLVFGPETDTSDCPWTACFGLLASTKWVCTPDATAVVGATNAIPKTITPHALARVCLNAKYPFWCLISNSSPTAADNRSSFLFAGLNSFRSSPLPLSGSFVTPFELHITTQACCTAITGYFPVAWCAVVDW